VISFVTFLALSYAAIFAANVILNMSWSLF
jgi:hypothetical protein